MTNFDAPTAAEFREACRAMHIKYGLADHYIANHLARFEKTYLLILGKLKAGTEVLSIGAGSAYVEAFLSSKHGANISVIDFPEQIERNQKHYDDFNFKTYPGNFLEDLSIVPHGKFDIVLYCEIVEHIPLWPKVQFDVIHKFLKPHGLIIVSTPNIARSRNVGKLMAGKNVVTSAQKMFAPVSFENEDIHRREYTLHEITSDLSAAAFKMVHSSYIWQKYPTTLVSNLKLNRILEFMVPRWKPFILVMAQASPPS